jgi:hypothetical protein
MELLADQFAKRAAWLTGGMAADPSLHDDERVSCGRSLRNNPQCENLITRYVKNQEREDDGGAEDAGRDRALPRDGSRGARRE